MPPPAGLRALVALAAAALLLVGCGEDEERASPARGTPADRAFLQAMVPHHESAIEMGTVARERGQDPFVKRLADDIVTTQEREIAQMKRIHERLFGSALEADEAAHLTLGLSAEEAGMAHSEADMRMLRTADPFDREFVDMMVPHHRGATRMAQVLLGRTTDTELRKLAQGIIDAQEREIREMNAFRKRRYGGPAPEAGGGDGAAGGGAGGAHGH